MRKNWVVNLFLETVIKQNSDDKEMCELLQEAIYNYGLHLHLIREEQGEMATHILEKLTETALAINRGEIDLPELQGQARLMFDEGIESFLAKIKPPE